MVEKIWENGRIESSTAAFYICTTSSLGFIDIADTALRLRLVELMVLGSLCKMHLASRRTKTNPSRLTWS